MTLTIDDLFHPATRDEWMASMLSVATTIGLPTTSWQAGEPERTILAIDAAHLSQEDAIISVMAQGGFLDFAASGTVTYVAANGQTVTAYVTPDPSIPSQNPDGSLGWLDLLGSSMYATARLSATYASGPMALVNTSVSSAGPYLAGTYHVVNTNTLKAYSNVTALTIPPSAIAGTGGVVTAVTVGATTTITTQTAHGLATGQTVFVNGTNGVTGLNGSFAFVTSTPTTTTFTIVVTTGGVWTSGGTVYLCTVANMAADVVGVPSNAAPGAVSTTVTQATGVRVFNLVSWSAGNYESNLAYAARCRLKLAAISPSGASQAYVYFALTAASKLAAQTPSIALSNGPIVGAVAFSNPQTGVVTTVISSSTPASTTLGASVTPGCTNLAITAATNATPIAITTASAHGLVTGNPVTIQGVLGNTNANGTWATITKTGASTFTLDGSIGNATYTGGGVVDGGDLGQVDQLIQANVVPDAVTATTESAKALPVTVSATVTVPQAFVGTYNAAVGPAIVAYLASLPIGGNTGVVPISAIEGALVAVGVISVGQPSYVRSVTGLTLNGSAADLAYPTNRYVAISSLPTITVVGV